MHRVTPLTGVTGVGSSDDTTMCTDWRYGRGAPVHVPEHGFDSGQSTIHGGTPLTGVKVASR